MSCGGSPLHLMRSGSPSATNYRVCVIIEQELYQSPRRHFRRPEATVSVASALTPALTVVFCFTRSGLAARCFTPASGCAPSRRPDLPCIGWSSAASPRPASGCARSRIHHGEPWTLLPLRCSRGGACPKWPRTPSSERMDALAEAFRPASCSGEGGIRTRGTVARTHDFQSCTFGRSVTSPGRLREPDGCRVLGGYFRALVSGGSQRRVWDSNPRWSYPHT